ncbi:hypothetical protein WN943_005734 [Citrus x changshan-huyou]
MSINDSVFSSLQCASDYLSEQMKNTNGLMCLYAYWRVLNKVWEKILVVSGRGYLRSVVQCWKPGKVIYLWKLNWVISTVKDLQGQLISSFPNKQNHSGHMPCLAVI